MRNEPALLVGLAEIILALAVSFGVDLSPEQTAAVLAAIVALGSLVTRQLAWGPKTVNRLLDAETVIGD